MVVSFVWSKKKVLTVEVEAVGREERVACWERMGSVDEDTATV
jgi:hypothetical protein